MIEFLNSAENFKNNFWLPLFESFPDLERREQVVIGGTFRDKIQVGSISTLSGIFKKKWLGIKPNNKIILGIFKYFKFCNLKDTYIDITFI